MIFVQCTILMLCTIRVWFSLSLYYSNALGQYETNDGLNHTEKIKDEVMIQRLPFTYWSGLSWYCKSRKLHCWNIFIVPKTIKLNITKYFLHWIINKAKIIFKSDSRYIRSRTHAIQCTYVRQHIDIRLSILSIHTINVIIDIVHAMAGNRIIGKQHYWEMFAIINRLFS